MIKINKFVVILIIIGIFLMIYINYNSNKADSKLEDDEIVINNEVYQKLSNEDIKKFIEENNIKLLGVNTVYNYNTIFIFGDLYSQGYYEVYKKNNVVSKGRKVIGSGNYSKSRPVIFSGGTASGNYPFVVLYILDDKLVNNKNYIEIIGENGYVSRFNLDQQAYAVETKILGRIVKYTVYDFDNKVLISEVR